MSSKPDFVKANFQHAKLLIVENNDDQWLLIQQALHECLPEVTPVRVATVNQTLSLLEDWRFQEWELPKLVLLNLYLPTKTDGWQLLKQLKAMATPISKVPTVMLSYSAERTDIDEAYELGISAYMVKPVEFTDWLSCFQHIRTYWWETVTLPCIQYKC